MKKVISSVTMSLLIGFSWSSMASASDSYIVKLKKGASEKSVRFFSNKSVQSVKSLNVSVGNFYSVQLNANKSTLKSLSADPAVEYVEKNQIYTISPVQEAPSLLMRKDFDISDSDFEDQWGLNNDGRNSSSWFSRGVAGEDVNILKAWDISTGDRDLIVAVIDTGVDYTHPDLADNMWVNEAEKNGVEGVDDDGNGYIDDIHGYDFADDDGDPMDTNRHGTHCAGVIGASHNSEGIRGVMADVQIMAVKFLGSRGGTTEDAIKSIDYAIKAGAHVLSNSWGGGGESQALREAIEAANDEGILFVAAAGNSRANNDSTETYPANYDVENVISVGAMNGKGERSSFSNYGKDSVHVFAPGSRIYSTILGGRYGNLDGTSMAAPFVSGAMGLLLSVDPNMTPLEARERLEATAVRNGKLDEYTRSGRMDVFALIDGL